MLHFRKLTCIILSIIISVLLSQSVLAYDQQTQNSIQNCEKMTNTGYKKECIFTLATTKKDATICNSLDNIHSSSDCYFELSKESNDHSICKIPENETIKNECLSRFALFVAKDAKSSLAICASISNQNSRDICYQDYAIKIKDYNICSKIQGSSTWCYYQIVSAVGGNVDICEKIPVATEKSSFDYREECLMKTDINFSNIKKFWSNNLMTVLIYLIVYLLVSFCLMLILKSKKFKIFYNSHQLLGIILASLMGIFLVFGFVKILELKTIFLGNKFASLTSVLFLPISIFFPFGFAIKSFSSSTLFKTSIWIIVPSIIYGTTLTNIFLNEKISKIRHLFRIILIIFIVIFLSINALFFMLW